MDISVGDFLLEGSKLYPDLLLSPHCVEEASAQMARFVSPDDARAGLVSHSSRVKIINLHLIHQSCKSYFMISENRAGFSGCGSSLNKLCTLKV